jgi:hypothetical protein
MEKIRTVCSVITMLLNVGGLTLFMYVNHLWIFK